MCRVQWTPLATSSTFSSLPFLALPFLYVLDSMIFFNLGVLIMFLQEKTFQHPYLSALGAHTWVKKPFVLTDYIVITCLNLVSDFHWPWSCYLTCSNYWRDHDTALFILRHLYRDIPEEPPTDGIGRRPIKLFYERDPFVEETPLTFADEASVKEFSRKVRTHTRKQDNDANCEASWWCQFAIICCNHVTTSRTVPSIRCRHEMEGQFHTRLSSGNWTPRNGAVSHLSPEIGTPVNVVHERLLPSATRSFLSWMRCCI